MINTIRRLIDPVKRKLMMIIGRAIVTYVDNTTGTQRIQLTVLANETVSNVERFEEYGLTSYPATDTQAVVLFLGGNRSHPIVINVHDRETRPVDLAESEVCLYSAKDADAQSHRIHLKADGSIEIKTSAGVKINDDVTVTGGDVVADGISLKTHTHSAGTYTAGGDGVLGSSGGPS